MHGVAMRTRQAPSQPLHHHHRSSKFYRRLRQRSSRRKRKRSVGSAPRRSFGPWRRSLPLDPAENQPAAHSAGLPATSPRRAELRLCPFLLTMNQGVALNPIAVCLPAGVRPSSAAATPPAQPRVSQSSEGRDTRVPDPEENQALGSAVGVRDSHSSSFRGASARRRRFMAPTSKKLLSQVLVAQGIDEGGSFSFTQRTLVWAHVRTSEVALLYGPVPS
jgi:hypothetical protein